MKSKVKVSDHVIPNISREGKEDRGELENSAIAEAVAAVAEEERGLFNEEKDQSWKEQMEMRLKEIEKWMMRSMKGDKKMLNYEMISEIELLIWKIRKQTTNIFKQPKYGFSFHFFTFAYQTRLWFVLLMLSICAFLNSLAATVAGWKTPRVIVLDLDGNVKPGFSGHVLPDFGHDILAYVLPRLFYFVPNYDNIKIYPSAGKEGPNTAEVVKSTLKEPYFAEDGMLFWSSGPDIFVNSFGYAALFLVVVHPRRFTILRRVLAVFCSLNFFRAIMLCLTYLPGEYFMHRYLSFSVNSFMLME